MIQTTRKIKAISLRPEEICAALRNETGTVRRVLKPQPASKLVYCSMGYQHGKWGYPAPRVYEEWGDDYRIPDGLSPDELNRKWTPPCHGDDILYVRETWRVQAAHRFEADVRIEYKSGGPLNVIQFPGHKSDGTNRTQYDQFISKWADNKWHSPVGMPREAARLFLLAKRVNMVRLQEVTVEEIENMGFQVELPPVCRQQLDPNFPTPEQMAAYERMTEEQKEEYIQNLARHTYIGWQDYANRMIRAFAEAWDRHIAPEDLPMYGWDANPWVWGMEYQKISREDALS